ncbi:MAG TPA: phosphatase PAP2 family protein, partial [Polyangiaceae bacterium]|nr:phosphatase PAP2 family protein [Polyangiaceae bacterium]
MTIALRPRVGAYSRRGVAFVLRHRWSVPLSLASTVSLAYLAAEMREGDLEGVDAVLAGHVQGWRGRLDTLMYALTAAGGGVGMSLVAVVTILVLARARRPRATLFMTTASIGTLLLVMGLKLLFQRARPSIAYMIETPSSFSFPSGHALGSMGVTASLVVVLYAVRAPKLVCRLATLLVALFVPGVALSRVYFGVHYPSDVVGGALAAAAWVS